MQFCCLTHQKSHSSRNCWDQTSNASSSVKNQNRNRDIALVRELIIKSLAAPGSQAKDFWIQGILAASALEDFTLDFRAKTHIPKLGATIKAEFATDFHVPMLRYSRSCVPSGVKVYCLSFHPFWFPHIRRSLGDSSSRALAEFFHLIGDGVAYFLWRILQLLFEMEILSWINAFYNPNVIRVIGRIKKWKGKNFPLRKFLNKSEGLNPKKPIPPQGEQKNKIGTSASYLSEKVCDVLNLLSILFIAWTNLILWKGIARKLQKKWLFLIYIYDLDK